MKNQRKMHEDEIRARAVKRVKEKKGFYIHFGIYAVCSLFFFLLNFLTNGGQGEWWFFFPVLGWGLGVVIHYIAVIGLPGTDLLNAEWEDREFKKEILRLQAKAGSEIDGLPPADELELKEPPVRNKQLSKDDWNDSEFV